MIIMTTLIMIINIDDHDDHNIDDHDHNNNDHNDNIDHDY